MKNSARYLERVLCLARAFIWHMSPCTRGLDRIRKKGDRRATLQVGMYALPKLQWYIGRYTTLLTISVVQE